jgi:hypothetical protein
MDMTPLAAWGAARKPGGAMRRHAMLLLLPRASSHSAITMRCKALTCLAWGNCRNPVRAMLRSAAPRPAAMGGAVGGRQAALGLLRDQIRSCVPSSPSIRRA